MTLIGQSLVIFVFLLLNLTHFLYRFSKHDQIGEIKIPLNQIDLAQTIEEWRDLTSVEEAQGQVNRILLGYLYYAAIDK